MGSHVPVLCFHIWSDDDSFEQKHVTEFLILIAIYVVVLLTGINYSIIAIHNGMAPIKGQSVFTDEWKSKRKCTPAFRNDF